ncbi:hypothetical protein CO174_03515 [Candidatus Uhrbacteria bacterium CG_4_9_14_3_um_filter_50_9]|uniref:Photosynthesis system II assembly factor Ycf48/Hcf136-like domain-containing protein n=1 Tax=Candidatus Uhrbacteria bacterium CG_4_9_14_3_um_filter_50_9 TaxID=1975035 RepID=A0A2M7XCC6_9BACT|nr:MAG: hypothetical protein CO174_03515 [Candidatus Uhrbacteria bacterium CG_4_9_14_3_um_filter_50_9]
MRISFFSVSAFVFTLTFFLAGSVHAAEWIEREDGTMQSIRGIVSVDEMISAVGNSGYTMYSEDAGASWTLNNKIASSWWHDVALDQDGDLVAVGDSGSYMISFDQGLIWSPLSLSTSSHLYAVDFNNGYGYMVGQAGTVLYYNSNTFTWTVGSSGVTHDLYDVQDNGDGTAWVVGNSGRLLYASNNGISWADLGKVADMDLRGVYFSTDDIGWVVGKGGTFRKTTDGGDGWVTISVEGLSTQDLLGIEAFGENMVVVGDGIVLLSSDAGETWEAHDFSEDYYEFYDAFYGDDGLLWVAGTIFDVYSSVWLYDAVGPEAPEAIAYFDFSTDEEVDRSLSWLEVEDVGSEVSSYVLVLDGEEMNVGLETTYDVGALSEGEHSASVYAIDTAGNTGDAVDFDFEVSDITIEEEVEVEVEVGEAEPGNLIKLVCVEGAETSDPCRAVYYYTEDGSRHAFPNEKVFFTWYDDFDDVVEVTGEFMSSLSLGANVTYHPGTRMVKFQSVPTVYAVEQGGILRAIASEEVAVALYGEDWNQQIDDISDAFFGNYSFGEDIDESEDYNPEDWEQYLLSLDDNF